MALQSVLPPTRTFDSRHTADACAACAAFCTGVTAMVVDAGTCDGLREKDLVERVDLTRGVFARHMGDMQRCLVTTYGRLADIVLDRFEAVLLASNTWEIGLHDGIVEAVQELDRHPGGAFLYFVAADRARDPVMWLERRTVQERFVHTLVTAPFPETFDEIRAEMFGGALHAIVRNRLLADDDVGDSSAVAADVRSLIDVFHPTV